MGCVGEGLVLDESTMARLRGVVGRGLGDERRSGHFPNDIFHIRTQTQGD